MMSIPYFLSREPMGAVINNPNRPFILKRKPLTHAKLERAENKIGLIECGVTSMVQLLWT